MWFRVILIVLIGAAYAPALCHAPRADQWSYLVDTMDHADLLDAIASTYSYNRTRQTMPCDTDLFRPLVFVVLAAERTLLEGDQRAVQVVGIILHCGVCLLLLALLQRIELLALPPGTRGSWLPHAIAAFYALNPAIQELVIWSHLQGYLLFLILVLGSMNLQLRFAASLGAPRLVSPRLWAAWVLALLAAFTHELGQVFAVFSGFFLALTLIPRVGLARAAAALTVFASILPIYQAVNLHDQFIHRDSYRAENKHVSMLDRLLTEDTVQNTARFVLYTTIQPFCTNEMQTSYAGERLHIEESLWQACGQDTGIALLVLCPILVLALIGMGGLLRSGNRLLSGLALWSAGLYAVFAAVTVLGRMNLHSGGSFLAGNSYYAYTGLLLALVTAFALGQGVGLNASAARTILAGVLLAMALPGGFGVWTVNAELAREMREVADPLQAVQEFVASHRDEANFSLAIDYGASDPVPRRYDRSITDIVFARWLGVDPRYRIAIRGRRAVGLD